MSWRADLAANLRRIILMDDKLERLGAEVAELRRETTALDRRVVRIETLIEMAESRRRREIGD